MAECPPSQRGRGLPQRPHDAPLSRDAETKRRTYSLVHEGKLVPSRHKERCRCDGDESSRDDTVLNGRGNRAVRRLRKNRPQRNGPAAPQEATDALEGDLLWTSTRSYLEHGIWRAGRRVYRQLRRCSLRTSREHQTKGDASEIPVPSQRGRRKGGFACQQRQLGGRSC